MTASERTNTDRYSGKRVDIGEENYYKQITFEMLVELSLIPDPATNKFLPQPPLAEYLVTLLTYGASWRDAKPDIPTIDILYLGLPHLTTLISSGNLEPHINTLVQECLAIILTKFKERLQFDSNENLDGDSGLSAVENSDLDNA